MQKKGKNWYFIGDKEVSPTCAKVLISRYMKKMRVLMNTNVILMAVIRFIIQMAD